MSTRHRVGEFVRGLGALAVLGGVLVGLPILLAVQGGWPLPTTIPSLDEIEDAISVGIDDRVVVKALLCLIWLVWAQVAVATVREVAAAARGRASQARALIPGLQALIGRLVASTALVVSSVNSLQVAAAGAVPAGPVAPVSQLVPASPATADTASSESLATVAARSRPVTPRAPTAPVDDDPLTVTVRRHDSWWSIAERTLGDGLRWQEVQDTNVGRTMPDGHTIAAGSDLLRPGWVIRLPPDAVVAEDDGDRQPVAATPAAEPSPPGVPAADPARGSSDEPTNEGPPAADPSTPAATAPVEATVMAGDSMWRIAERRLDEVLGRQASTPEVAIYWATVVEANRDRFIDATNPDLIHVGQRFVLPDVPAVLAPRPPAPAPAPAAEPPPGPAPSPQPGDDRSPPEASSQDATGRSSAEDGGPADQEDRPTPPGPADQDNGPEATAGGHRAEESPAADAGDPAAGHEGPEADTAAGGGRPADRDSRPADNGQRPASGAEPDSPVDGPGVRGTAPEAPASEDRPSADDRETAAGSGESIGQPNGPAGDEDHRSPDGSSANERPRSPATAADNEPATGGTADRRPSTPDTTGRSNATAEPSPARSQRPSADATGSEDDSDGNAAGTSLLLAGASAGLAVGVTRAVRRRRRRRNHRAPNVVPATPEDNPVHRRLLADADDKRVDALGEALDDLARKVARAGQPCRPLVVQHGTDHLDVLLDEPTRPAVEGWNAQASGEVWELDAASGARGTGEAEGDNTADSPHAPTMATPLLVTLGQLDDGGHLYLDLEAAAVVTMTGDDAAAAAQARSMVVELAHSTLAANAHIVVVGEGIGTDQLPGLDRVTVVESWADVADDLVAWSDQSQEALAGNDWPNAFVARGDDPEHDALIPLVVVAGSPPDDIDLLEALHAGPTAAAVAYVGEPLPGSTVLDCRPDHLSLPELGLTCRPRALTADDVDAIADLLAEADDPTGEPLVLDGLTDPGRNGDHRDVDGTYQDRPYEILVRLLGEVSVEGGSAPLTGKQTALVAYIALHGTVGADRASDAVWTTPAAVSARKRLANVITKCRAALGARHLPVARDGRYTVGPDVATDVDLFEQRMAAAGRMPPDRAAETLHGALDLVTGPVFTYPSTEQDSYSWVDVENWVSRWELTVTAVAERTAAAYMDLDRPGDAAVVAEHALRVVPTHSGLTEALMQAHAANGDRRAMQRVYEAHVNALTNLDLDTVAPSTADLYERLRTG